MPLVTKGSLLPLIEQDSDISMSIIELENPKGYGRVIIENGEVKEIVEEKDCTPAQREIQSAKWGGLLLSGVNFSKSTFPNLKNDNAQGEYYLTDIVKIGG